MVCFRQIWLVFKNDGFSANGNSGNQLQLKAKEQFPVNNSLCGELKVAFMQM